MITRVDGTQRDLRKANRCELVVIANSLEARFREFSRVYRKGFDPPKQQKDRAEAEIFLEYENCRTLRDYARLHGLDMSEEVDRALTRYSIWLGLSIGMEVWNHKHLSFGLKQKLKSAHYRALRVIHRSKDLSRDELDAISCRADPEEMSYFNQAKILAKMVINRTPSRLYENVMQNSYTERRYPGRVLFYDSSHKKIGRQSFKNRLSAVSKQMKSEWLFSNQNSLRVLLKKHFFKYYK
jgi:hypothetical protein